jgi:hypothetical protein
MSVLSQRPGLVALPQQRWAQAIGEADEGQVDLDLEVGALWRARGDQRWRIIACRKGVVWITQDRDVADYVLREGEVFIVTLPGPVLVQALEPASVTITPSIKARPYVGNYHVFR